MDLAYDIEILAMMQLTALIEYPNEFADNYVENRLFKQIRDFLNIEIDVFAIMEQVGYNHGKRESPAVMIYYPGDCFDNFMLLDTYIGATDQLDLIDIGFGCSKQNAFELRKLVRRFYDETCRYNIFYCEGANPVAFKYKNDFRKFEDLRKQESISTIPGKKYLFYRGKELLFEAGS